MMELASMNDPSSIMLFAATEFRLNMFDAVLVGVVGYGIWRGKQEGFSGEHMGLLQWSLISLPGGNMAGALGAVFEGLFSTSLYWGQILGFVLWAAMVVGGFSFLASKGKFELGDGDTFGRFEYPLGILGGAIKNFCILLAVISLLNGRYYTAEQIAASRAAQVKEFGSALIPTPPLLSQNVFQSSFFGPKIKKYMSWAMLTPIPKVTPVR